jgi:predicted enzyme related to lactoylglutathione lyase
MHGQFVWYELTTPDVDAAKKFYPRFTGWGTQRFDDDYTIFTTGGTPVAGLFRLKEEMRQQGVPPNWMPYVEADDVDATAAKATSLGGRVLQGPADIPGTGRFAVVQDPQGAVFGIYKASNGMSGAWDGTNVVGRFSWHELMTTDAAKAFEFYRALFGWDKNGEMDMGGGQTYDMYGKGDKMYGGMFNRPPEMAGMPPFWLVYIHVRDVGKALATAVKAGATVQRPQMDIPGGAIAILGDPQGAGFALHHANAQVAATKPAAKPPAKSPPKKAAKRVAKPAAKPAAPATAKRAKKAAMKTTPKKKAKTTSRRTTTAKTKARATSTRKPNARAKTKSGAKRATKQRSRATPSRATARRGRPARAKKR